MSPVCAGVEHPPAGWGSRPRPCGVWWCQNSRIHATGGLLLGQTPQWWGAVSPVAPARGDCLVTGAESRVVAGTCVKVPTPSRWWLPDRSAGVCGAGTSVSSGGFSSLSGRTQGAPRPAPALLTDRSDLVSARPAPASAPRAPVGSPGVGCSPPVQGRSCLSGFSPFSFRVRGPRALFSSHQTGCFLAFVP